MLAGKKLISCPDKIFSFTNVKFNLHLALIIKDIDSLLLHFILLNFSLIISLSTNLGFLAKFIFFY